LRSLVLDTNIVVKILLGEPDSDAAAGLLTDPNSRFMVPVLFDQEVGDVLIRSVRRGAIDPEQASRLFRTVQALPIPRATQRGFSIELFELALSRGMGAADAQFVSLALDQACPLVTDDKRLIEQCNGLLETLTLAQAHPDG
jgi:predicted nucleic acid-binding protein